MSLDIKINKLGENNNKTAQTYMCIGTAYFYKEDHDNALSNFQKSL